MTDTSSGLRTLSRQFSRYPELNQEQEKHLIHRWQRDHDAEAARQLMNANLRHVAAIASSFRRYGIPAADLVAEGCLGMRHALDKFEPERELRFITYAAYWVRANMTRCALSNRSIVRSRGGPMRSALFFKLRRERARAYARFGEGELAWQALEQSLGMSEERIQKLFNRLDATDASLDAPGESKQGSPLVDRLSNAALAPDQELAAAHDQTLIQSVVHSALEILNPRERMVVQNRFLAASEDEVTLTELGARMGVSRERARQIQARAAEKLRAQIQTLLAAQNQDVHSLLAAS